MWECVCMRMRRIPMVWIGRTPSSLSRGEREPHREVLFSIDLATVYNEGHSRTPRWTTVFLDYSCYPINSCIFFFLLDTYTAVIFCYPVHPHRRLTYPWTVTLIDLSFINNWLYYSKPLLLRCLPPYIHTLSLLRSPFSLPSCNNCPCSEPLALFVRDLVTNHCFCHTLFSWFTDLKSHWSSRSHRSHLLWAKQL